MSFPFVPLGVILLLLPIHHGPVARSLSSLAMESPWWENYDQKDRYLCSEKNVIVLERNASQASLITGNQRSTLFREDSSSTALLFRNGDMKLTLRGDEMILERFPQTIRCIRTEEV
jgi:hypothetical protein